MSTRDSKSPPSKRLGGNPAGGIVAGYPLLTSSACAAPADRYTWPKRGAENPVGKVNGGAKKGYVNAFGAITAGQAMQQAKAGLEAVYLSGWQVAADGNTSETMYPDQSLYAYDSVPTMVRRINNTFKRADEIQWSRGINPGDEGFIDYFLPIVADAEAGFGGVLNAFELMKNMIAAGAAGVTWEDQLAAVKKCGHMGGKVLVPTREAVRKADRRPFRRRRHGRADPDPGPYRRRSRQPADLRLRRQRQAVSSPASAPRKASTASRTASSSRSPRRGLRPYADLVWCETGVPDIGFAREFAQAVLAACPGQAAVLQLLAVLQLEEEPGRLQIHRQVPGRTLGTGLGYQFITLAGIHINWYNTFQFAHAYARGEGMKHYVNMVQEPEFAAATGLHLRVAPAGSRRRLLRRRHHRDPGRFLLRQGPHRLHRRRAVPLSVLPLSARRCGFHRLPVSQRAGLFFCRRCRCTRLPNPMGGFRKPW